MKNYIIHEKIAHLSPVEIEDLVNRYYAGESIKALLEAFRIEAHPSQLVKIFPPVSTDKPCPYCKQPLLGKRPSKYYDNKNDLSYYCNHCGHKEDGYCSCTNCEKKLKEKEAETEKLMKAFCARQKTNSVDFNRLTLEEKVFLGLFLTEGFCRASLCIKPVEDFFAPFSPSRQFTWEIIDTLHDDRLITVNEHSDFYAFENLDREDYEVLYDFSRVKWDLNVKCKKGILDSRGIRNHLRKPPRNFSIEEAYDLWIKIAAHECAQYWHYQLYTMLDFVTHEYDKETLEVFKNLLKKYSVSQIYALITRELSESSIEKVKKRKKKVTLETCNNALERIKNYSFSNTKIEGSNAIDDLPESALSRFFFNTVLGIGEAGFYERPNKDV